MQYICNIHATYMQLTSLSPGNNGGYIYCILCIYELTIYYVHFLTLMAKKEIASEVVRLEDDNDDALWARIIKNPDVSTGPLAHLFARSLARAS